MRCVLVHGSWHDGSLWGLVAERLRADGHEDRELFASIAAGSEDNNRLVQMPGSHEVIFTNPDGPAAKLVEAGRD
jgi:hypothetical protein